MSNTKLSFTKMAKALTGFRSRSRSPAERQPLDSRMLQEQLDNARPAEQAYEAWDYREVGAKYTDVCHKSDPGDGLWVCCCSHENRLVHYQGAFPFKHLECGRCGHVLCPDCRTSEIITPIHSTSIEVFEERAEQTTGESRYFQLCRACGLTHRAIRDGNHIDFFKTACPCGKPALKADSCFYIGEVDTWRSDPTGQAVALRLERIIASSQQIIAARGDSSVCATRSRLQSPRPRVPRAQVSQPGPKYNDRPQQPPRSATAVELTLPHRQGAIRRPSRRPSAAAGSVQKPPSQPHQPPQTSDITYPTLFTLHGAIRPPRRRMPTSGDPCY